MKKNIKNLIFALSLNTLLSSSATLFAMSSIDTAPEELHLAAHNGDHIAVHTILQASLIPAQESSIPLVAIQNSEGQTALMIAAQQGHEKVVQELLSNAQQEAYLEQQDKNGNTALMYGIWANNQKIVTLLLNRSSNPNIEKDHHITALMNATNIGHYDIAHMILRESATFTHNNFTSKTLAPMLHVLAQAARNNNSPLTTLLVEKLACLHKKIQLSQSVDTNKLSMQYNEGINDSFSYALGAKCPSIVTFFLDASFTGTYNLKPEYKIIALIKSATEGWSNIIDMLITHHGIHPDDFRDQNSKTALMIAVEYKHIDTVQTLLKHNSAIDLLDDENATALIQAVRTGNLPMVEILFNALERHPEKDTLINHKSSNGHSALLTALQRDTPEHEAIATFLIKAAHDRYSLSQEDGVIALHTAAEYGRVSSTKALAALGIPIDAPNENNYTSLMTATIQEKIEVMSALIELNANVNAVDESGMTALMLSTANTTCIPTQILIRANATIDHQSNTLQTALMNAIEAHNPDIAAPLLEAQAVVDLQNESGASALAIALIKNHSENLVRILILAGANPLHANEITTVTPWALATPQKQKYMEKIKQDRESGLFGALALAQYPRAQAGLPDIGEGISSLICDLTTHPFSRQNRKRKKREMKESATYSAASPEPERDDSPDLPTHSTRQRRNSLFNMVCQSCNTSHENGHYACSICNRSLALIKPCRMCSHINNSLQLECALCGTCLP